MVCSEVLVKGAIFEHVVRGSEDGSGDSTDGLLGAAAGSNAQVLSVEVSFLGARGRPCALDQSGLQPGRSLLHTRGAAFSSAFVVPGAESGPGNQIAFGGEPAHIGTDLRHDHLGREAADARNGFQHFDGYAKGFDVAVDLLINAANGRIQSIQLIQKKKREKK